MKTTDESYLNRIKRVSTLSKFSRYKLIKNSKIDFNSATKEFNKISNRLENLYLSREDQKTFRKNKRYLLVKTFTFKMNDKVVSTVPVSQDEINTLNLITPVTKKEENTNNQNILISDVLNIRDELVDIRKYQHQFKKTIRLMISENNGLTWIKQLQKFYKVNFLLSKIKHTSADFEILNLLKNTKYLKKDINIIISS